MQQWQDKIVGVLMGGISREREISLRTGNAMADALVQGGYQVERIDVTRDLVQQLRDTKIDVAVIALHGAYGEDGSVQGVLEYLQIPYTGAGVMGSAVAMDKALCKAVARDLGVMVPRDQLVYAGEESTWAESVRCELPYPVVVKPACEGSTIGMTIVRDQSAFATALQLAAQSDDKILIEEYIDGAEVTVGVLAGETLPSIEIIPQSGFYDYEAKYTKGATEYLIPARIPEDTVAQINDWSLALWKALDCDGVARADYIVRSDGQAVLLEINTVPGMTETSLVPKAAHYAGYSFAEVCERILASACLKLGNT